MELHKTNLNYLHKKGNTTEPNKRTELNNADPAVYKLHARHRIENKI